MFFVLFCFALYLLSGLYLFYFFVFGFAILPIKLLFCYFTPAFLFYYLLLPTYFITYIDGPSALVFGWHTGLYCLQVLGLEELPGQVI